MKKNKIRIISFCAAITIITAMLAGCVAPSSGGGQETLKPDNKIDAETLDSAASENPEKKQEDFLEKYKDLSDEQIFEYLQTLPKDEFTEEVKTGFSIFINKDVNKLIIFAVSLRERINEYSEKEILSMIEDQKNDLVLRVSLLQCLSSDVDYTPETNERLLELLSDDSTENDIKENIIVDFDFNDEAGFKILHSIACGDDDLLAFHAIRRLDEVNSEDAVSISRNILETYKTQTPEKINAALKTMSKFYREARIKNSFTEETEQEKSELIEICEKLINKSDNSQKLKDSATLALSEMTDAEAITSIIENPNIDDVFKSHAVEQNYLTLSKMAEHGSEKEIEVVCQAIAINPIKELKEPLLTYKSSQQAQTAKELSAQTTLKIDEAISKIDSSGVNVDEIWTEFYNEVSK